MNPPRCDALDYIQFLIAAQRTFTCTEAARCAPPSESAPAHDAFTRLLQRQPPETAALWQEVRRLVRAREGVLVLDDTTLDKPYMGIRGTGYSNSSWEFRGQEFRGQDTAIPLTRG